MLRHLLNSTARTSSRWIFTKPINASACPVSVKIHGSIYLWSFISQGSRWLFAKPANASAYVSSRSLVSKTSTSSGSVGTPWLTVVGTVAFWIGAARYYKSEKGLRDCDDSRQPRKRISIQDEMVEWYKGENIKFEISSPSLTTRESGTDVIFDASVLIEWPNLCSETRDLDEIHEGLRRRGITMTDKNEYWVDLCQSLSRIDGAPKLNHIPYLVIVVDDTVDIHEAALAFIRLVCVIHLHEGASFNTLALAPVGSSIRVFCHKNDDPYEVFMENFSRNLVARKDLCEQLKKSTGQRLIFSGLDVTYCGADRHPSLHLLLGRWYSSGAIRYPNGSLVRSTDQLEAAKKNLRRVDVLQKDSIKSIYELAFRLGNAPFNSSLVKVVRVDVIRPNRTSEDFTNHGFYMVTFYLAALLVFILILFLSLLNLLNVDENYTYVLQQIIRQRVRRQRARLMADMGENGEEEEEGEERRNRRNRRNSEEQSLLGTDENTIRTALSGRFPSISSLSSYQSADSRMRRSSLESLVIDDPSEVATSGAKEESGKEKVSKK